MLAAFAALLFSPSTQAQDYPAPQNTPTGDYETREWNDDEIPAHVAVVDGDATIEREGRVDPLEENIVLLAGDRLRTNRGRVEVLYSDGSALDLDHNTSVDLLDDALVRLNDGRMRLAIARGGDALDYRVDSVAGSAFIRQAGDYRLTVFTGRTTSPELDLVVMRGSAELSNEHGRTLVRAGSHALVSARTAPSLPYAANSASWDAFDRWVEDQHNARVGVSSSRHLPSELRYYGGSFDRYGSWEYEPSYGYVWYPTVSVGWRPYWHGRWSYVGPYGWTWVGFDRWSWATHHYGRWGYRNRWYWIPGRRWSPAWVSWAHSPSYVSWCPLGFDNRPVISITNIHVTRVDPLVAWTVVPTRAFTTNLAVSRYAVPRPAISSAGWSQFVEQRTAPIRPANVSARTVQPLRAPTLARPGSAMPREGTRAVTPLAPRTSPPSTGSRASEAPAAAPRRSPAPQVIAPQRLPGDDSVGSRATSRAPSRAPEMRPEPTTPPAAASPSRGYRSREPETQAPRSAAPSASPWIRSRPPDAAPQPQPDRTPSRGARPRGLESAPWVEAPSTRTAPPVMRSRPSEPEPSAPPSRGWSRAPERQAPPSPPNPSGTGWGSGGERSRVPPPPAAQPAPRSRGGDTSSSSSTSSSGGTTSGSRAAPRRGGGN